MDESPLQRISQLGHQLARLTRPNKDQLVKSLREAANALSQIEQPPVTEPLQKMGNALGNAEKSLEASITPLRKSIIKLNLLRLRDKDVKLLVGVCVSEIFRILAPRPPFEDKHLRDVFELIISMFAELGDVDSPYFSRRVKVLEIVARCRCCVIMLDIDCNDLVVRMFEVFFSAVREDHQQSLINDMMLIMTRILDEEVSPSLVDVILQNLVTKGNATSLAASRLAASVIQSTAEKLETLVCGFLASCFLDGDSVDSELRESYHEILYEIFLCAPQMLLAVIPSLAQELVTDQVDVRIKAVNLVGKLISLPGHRVAQKYRNLFIEFKNRFSDKSVEVRLSAIQCAKACYMANPSGNESHELLTVLEGRLLDFDDRVRTQAMVVICDLARSNLKNFPVEVVSNATQRLRDKKMSVRKKALQKLMELYRDYCLKCPEGQMAKSDFFEQIPCKVLMLYYDRDCKEFRSHNLEGFLAEDLFPISLSAQQRTRHWIQLFSLFTSLHENVLNSFLSKKWRLQTEMKTYLALRKKEKDTSPEQMQRRLRSSFVKMAALFPEPSKAEECFYKLNEIKDNKIFNALEQLLDERTIEKAWVTRDNFLKLVGDQCPNSEFLQELSSKCSSRVFGSESICCILDYLSSDDYQNEHFEVAAIKLLAVVISNFPPLLRGSEEQYLKLLKKNPTNDLLIHALAKSGPYISVKFSNFYPLLEKLCMEGTRFQSKHAVSAIAALSGSSEQLLFPKLCKKLVDSLRRGGNLPTLLQSLGCIAQHSVSTFEELYGEIRIPLFKMILEVEECGVSSSHETDCCDSCKLKIYALKALVKCFLPRQGSHLHGQLNEVLDILLKMLQPFEVSGGCLSSTRDKHHLRLAAAKALLQLSRRWDLHVPPDIFRLAVLTAKDPSPWIRKSFLSKVHKLLKERAIPSKYSCAFALAVSDCCEDLQYAALHHMEDFIREYASDARIIQLPAEQGGLPTDCPAYIVVFLIHVLAHDHGFPLDDCHDEEEYANFLRPLFWVVQVLLNTTLLHGDVDFASDSALYFLSVFRAIRKADDAIDTQGTPKLQILAEIGISFVNALKPIGISSLRAPAVILLPSSLFRIGLVKKCNQVNVESFAPFTFEGGFIKRVIHILESQFPRNFSTCGVTHAKQSQQHRKKSADLRRDGLKLISCGHDSSSVAIEMQKVGTQEICTEPRWKQAPFPSTFATLELQNECSVGVCKNDESKCSKSILEKHPSSRDSASIKPFLIESQTSILKAGSVLSLKEKARVRSGFNGEFSKSSRSVPKDSGGRNVASGNEVLVGKRIKLMSPDDGCFYAGTVVGFDSRYNTHKISYDSGHVELLSLDSESWETIEDGPSIEKDITVIDDSNPLHGSSSAGELVNIIEDRPPRCSAYGEKRKLSSAKQKLGKKGSTDTSASEVVNVSRRTRRQKV